MNKRKICIVITARPSYSRIKTAMLALKNRSDVHLQIVLTSSALIDRFGNVSTVVEADGFKIDEKVVSMVDGGDKSSMVKTTALGMIELTSIFNRLKPDLVVTIADRYETLGTAIAASFMNIPLAHIQGGEVTGSVDDKVRHSVTKLSNYHLVSTKLASQRVISMGEAEQFVFNVGCPSIDIAKNAIKDNEFYKSPFETYGGVGESFDIREDFVVLMQHSVTSESEVAENQMEQSLKAVQALGKPALVFWPNPDAGSEGVSKSIRRFRENERCEKMHFFRNIGPLDFLKILTKSRCLIGNSSVGIRESSYLGVPVVNVGTRQNGRERCVNVKDVDYNWKEILNAATIQVSKGRYPSSELYGNGNSGEKIGEILATIALTSEKRITY